MAHELQVAQKRIELLTERHHNLHGEFTQVQSKSRAIEEREKWKQQIVDLKQKQQQNIIRTLAQKRLARLRATEVIQRYARGFAARHELRKQRFYATQIQRVYRGHAVRFQCQFYA